MRFHTQAFKDEIKEHGREFDDRMQIRKPQSLSPYSQEHIKRFNYSVDTSLLKSVMQKIELETDVNLDINDKLQEYELKLVSGESVSFNNFIITEKEQQEDKKGYRYTCYDNMIKAMVDYVTPKVNGVEITYPITVRNYLSAICSHLGITFAHASTIFTNYNKEITSEHYLDSDGNSLGYTFRDVLDDLAEVIGGFLVISEGYLGIRYPSVVTQPSSRLPSGYTEVEYIQSSGTQYIDTGMKLNQDSKVELKVSNIIYGSTRLFGSRSSATLNNFSILTTASGMVLDFQNYNNNRLSVSSPTDPVILSMSKTKLKANDLEQNVSTYTNFETPETAYIFNGHGTFPGGYSNASMKLHYCKIWQGNLLVRNFVPCKNSNDVVGLYDLANDVFYENAGTGTFTAGSEVVEVDTINEEYFQDNNVNIGKKFGPINVVTLSRNGVDNLVRPTGTLPENICEIKIENNPILDQTNREDFIDGIYNQLNGLEFYLNDFQMTGVCYYTVGDIYNVSINGTTYPCLLLNDNIIRDNGLSENIYTEEPTTSVTDHKYSSDSDKLGKTARNAYFLADKANGTASMIVEGIGNNGEVTGASVIAAINDDDSSLTLNAGKIALEGYTTINGGFAVDDYGTVSITDGSIVMYDNPDTDEVPKISIHDSVDRDKVMSNLWSNQLFTFIKYNDHTEQAPHYDEAYLSVYDNTDNDLPSTYAAFGEVNNGVMTNGVEIAHTRYIDSSTQDEMTATYLYLTENGIKKVSLGEFSEFSQLEVTGQTELDGNTTIGGTLYYGSGGRSDNSASGFDYDRFGNMQHKSTGASSNSWQMKDMNGNEVVRIYPETKVVRFNGVEVKGYIQETGSNANGQYVKYSDGTLICWNSIGVLDQAISSAYGSLYQGTRTITFPISFITTPSVTCSQFRWGSGASWGSVDSILTNQVTLRGIDIASRSAGTTVRISWFAIGKWK